MMFILMMLGLASADDNCFEVAEITARYGGKIVGLAKELIIDKKLYWRFEIPQSIFTKNDVGALKADHDWVKLDQIWFAKKPHLSRIYATQDGTFEPSISSLKMEDKTFTIQKEIVKICTLK